MAKFSICIRKEIAKHEFASVYIRISHNSKTDYIRTAAQVGKQQVRGTEIKDYLIISQLSGRIAEYIEKLNKIDSEAMTVQEIKNYLLKENEEISFTEYFSVFIKKMSEDKRDNPADNYITSLNSLKKFISKQSDIKKLTYYNINFSALTTKIIREWIESLQHTARAKQLYPRCISAVFNSGLNHYNDYDRGIMRIKNNPFKNNKIPPSDLPKPKELSVENFNKITNAETKYETDELAKDVSKLIFYLAGINVADLYFMEKSNLDKSWKLCYNRHKTKTVRRDKSYIEITVPEEIRDLFSKYKGWKKLFNFSERYTIPDNFTVGINEGLEIICKSLGIEKITSYYLRHAWATIAQNNCGADTELVGFCLNHASAHRVTAGYIKKDFSKIDTLNRKVIDFVMKR